MIGTCYGDNIFNKCGKRMNESLLLIDCHLINMFQTLGTQQQQLLYIFLGPPDKIVWKWQNKNRI